MSRTLTNDDLEALSPDEVLDLWERVNTVKTVRAADPELRAAILARAAEALLEGRVDEREAGQIRAQLDQFIPSAVLAGHWRGLIRDRAALGAFGTEWRKVA
jgi:hypothetical protein